MEQKKTLWIVAAAGIFLLVVVGAALIIYSPSLHNAPVQQASFDPSTGWVNASALASSNAENSDLKENPASDVSAEKNLSSNIQGSPDVSPEPFDPLAQNQNQSQIQNSDSTAGSGTTAASGAGAVINTQNVNVYAQGTTTFDLNALKAASSSSEAGSANVTAQNEKTAEQLAKASETKAESAAAESGYYAPSSSSSSAAASKTASSSKQTASAKSTASKTAASSSAAASSSKQTTSAKSTASSSSSASSKTAEAKKVAEASKAPANLFWVQVGAYSSKKNADSARETLEQNKIPVEVFTDGKYYKVRAGSFTTKSEAIYWQKMIAEIGKFADSKTMVVNSAVQK